MRKLLLTIATTGAIFASLAFADSFNGKLLDTTCLDQQQKTAAACQATSNSTAFAIEVSGKTYRLDDAGNQKTVRAMKDRADRSTDPTAASAPMNAKITGTLDGDIIKVETIDVQ